MEVCVTLSGCNVFFIVRRENSGLARLCFLDILPEPEVLLLLTEPVRFSLDFLLRKLKLDLRAAEWLSPLDGCTMLGEAVSLGEPSLGTGS